MSDATYVFVSNGNDSECDGKEGEYEGDPPDRPHPNCQCKIDEKLRERGCVTMQLELDGVDFDPPPPPAPVPGGDGDGEEYPYPKLEIDDIPEPMPPREWFEVIPCCTFHYHIECANGFTKSGLITVCPPDAMPELDDYEFWEMIVCPFMLEGAEEEAWEQLEEIVDEVLEEGECACIA